MSSMSATVGGKWHGLTNLAFFFGAGLTFLVLILLEWTRYEVKRYCTYSTISTSSSLSSMTLRPLRFLTGSSAFFCGGLAGGAPPLGPKKDLMSGIVNVRQP